MDIIQEKEILRKRIKVRKKSFSDTEKMRQSAEIFRQAEALKVFQDALGIMVYWSLDDEVFTHDVILKWYRQKHILLPVIRGENLEVVRFSGPDRMVRKEPYHIPEPIGDTIDPGLIELAIVPGVAFDVSNHRLGRGKAFYDRFLHQTEAFKLGLCFDFQLFNSIPVSESDVKMDLVLSG